MDPLVEEVLVNSSSRTDTMYSKRWYNSFTAFYPSERRYHASAKHPISSCHSVPALLLIVSNSAKECGNCRNEFDGGARCPRNLPCCGSLCTLCIQQLIDKDNEQCPLCNNDFEATSTQELDINKDLVFLLKCEKDLEATVRRRGLVESQETLTQAMKDEKRNINGENISSCQLTHQQIKCAIRSNNELKAKITKIREMLKHIQEEVGTLDEKHAAEVKYIDKINKRLKTHLKAVTGCQEHLDKERGILYREATLQNVDAVLEAEVARVSFPIWNEEFKMIRSDQEKAQQKLEEVEKNTTDVEGKIIELRNLLDSLVDKETTLVKFLASHEDGQEQLTPEIKLQMKEVIRSLAALGRIAAVKESKYASDRKLAKLSLSDDDKVLLHCLRRGEGSRNVITINQPMLMKYFDMDNGLTFLELSRNESVLGRLFIRPSGGENGKIFSSYCIGEFGDQSWLYINISNISRMGKLGENLRFLLAPMTDSSGSALVWNESRDETNSEGLVWGVGNRGFSITTRGNPLYKINKRIGMVEFNFNILTDAIAENPNVGAICITDCGLVMPE